MLLLSVAPFPHADRPGAGEACHCHDRAPHHVSLPARCLPGYRYRSRRLRDLMAMCVRRMRTGHGPLTLAPWVWPVACGVGARRARAWLVTGGYRREFMVGGILEYIVDLDQRDYTRDVYYYIYYRI